MLLLVMDMLCLWEVYHIFCGRFLGPVLVIAVHYLVWWCQVLHHSLVNKSI
jgi:hypothetical protein